jgi:hypothetical protein
VTTLLEALRERDELRAEMGRLHTLQGHVGCTADACHIRLVDGKVAALERENTRLTEERDGAMREYERMRESRERACANARRHAQENTRLRSVLAVDTPWPFTEVLRRLAEAGEHLLGEHSCDTHGHEGIRDACNAARRILASLGSQPGSTSDNGTIRQPLSSHDTGCRCDQCCE